jgi:ABC-type sugar transport system permease subunit
MIVYLAGLQSIPVSLYEAARIDGAGVVQQFLKITVPMLRPVTFFLLIMASIKAFNVFEQVNIMTNGGPMNATTTIMHQIYQKAFLQFEMGYASSMAVLMLVFTFIFTILIFKYGQGYEAES